jgi:aldehyde:ferredoxin oxidoreductase
MEPKILHLNLFKKWFDEIKSGEKKEEYRDKKEYWTKRLFNSDGTAKDFDFIVFRNGYSKQAPKINVEFLGVREDGDRYAILLGDVFEKV